MLLAIRSNERAAGSVGINVAQAKLMAFGIAAFIAGIGGGLTGYMQGELTADGFAAFMSLGLLAIVFVAGVGRISGAVVAGVMFSAAGLFVTFLDIHLGVGKYQAIVAGVALVLTAVQNPDGVTSTATGKGPAVGTRQAPRPRAGQYQNCAPAPGQGRGPRRRGPGGGGEGGPDRTSTKHALTRLSETPAGPAGRASRDGAGSATGRACRGGCRMARLPQFAYRIRGDNGWDRARSSDDSVLVPYDGPSLGAGSGSGGGSRCGPSTVRAVVGARNASSSR